MQRIPVKNLDYPEPGFFDNPWVLRRAAVSCKANSLEIAHLYLRIGMQKEGVQYVVDKGVSDDLLNTDFKGAVSFSDMKWPARWMEFYFQDPNIPTMILSVTSLNEIKSIGLEIDPSGANVGPDDKLFRLGYSYKMEGYKDGAVLIYMSMLVSEMNDYVSGSVEQCVMGDRAEPLTEEENQEGKDFCLLLLKVLIYASIPRYAPARILGKKQYPSYGGKHGVKGRPVRPAFRVQYLPLVIQADHKKNESLVGREFKGKRGHFHHYGVTEAGKKFFKNRAGTFDWFPPVKGPNGEMPTRMFRVRKPKLFEKVG